MMMRDLLEISAVTSSTVKCQLAVTDQLELMLTHCVQLFGESSR